MSTGTKLYVMIGSLEKNFTHLQNDFKSLTSQTNIPGNMKAEFRILENYGFNNMETFRIFFR